MHSVIEETSFDSFLVFIDFFSFFFSLFDGFFEGMCALSLMSYA